MAENVSVRLLEIHLFGRFEVEIEGNLLLPLRSSKHEELLALLVSHANREVERSWLADILWDTGEKLALNSLRNALYHVRKTLGSQADRLCVTDRTLCLNLTDAFVDLIAFRAAIRSGTQSDLEEAVSLYQGQLLPGWTQDWVLAARRDCDTSYIHALETLAETARDLGDKGAAIKYLRLAVQTDPLQERTQRALMQALAVAGEYGAVVQAYRELQARLHTDLKAKPHAETVTLMQQISIAAPFVKTNFRLV